MIQLPTIAASSPTVSDSITYGLWVLQQLTIIGPTQGPSDPYALQTPFTATAVLNKGRWHPDGYWQNSPVDQPATVQIANVVSASNTDSSVDDLMTGIISYLGALGTAQGVLSWVQSPRRGIIPPKSSRTDGPTASLSFSAGTCPRASWPSV